MRANIYKRQRKPSESLAASNVAKQHINSVIAGDTSGRSETLALAHKSMASLLIEGAPGMIEKETICHFLNRVNLLINPMMKK